MAKEETAAASDGKRSITIRVDVETFVVIEKLAIEDERSVSQYVERHLRKSFKPTSAPVEGYGFTGDKPKTIG